MEIGCLVNMFMDPGNWTVLNKPLAKELGNDAAILLMRYVELTRYYKGVFYQTRPNLQEAVNINSKKQVRIDNKLKELGLISITRKGIPPVNYYTIHENKIAEYFQSLVQLGQNDSINPVDSCSQKNNIEQHNNYTPNGVLQTSTPLQSDRPKLKRRKPVESKASQVRRKSKELKSDPIPPLHIPKRTHEALMYWLSKDCLPNLVVDLDNPTKKLKQTVKTLSLFFEGKLFRDGFANLRTGLTEEHRDQLKGTWSIDDFKDAVDDWENVLTSGKYKVNTEYLSTLSLTDFLAGNPFVKNGNGGLYSPLIDYCYFEPERKIVDKYPITTINLIKTWTKYIGSADKHDRDQFVQAANRLRELHDIWSKTNSFSSPSKFPDVIRLGIKAITRNEDYLKKVGAGPTIMLGPWFKKQVLSI